MPGITDVVRVATGVAVRGQTFGQCIDAVRALEGRLGGRDRSRASPTTTSSRELRKARTAAAAAARDLLAKSVERRLHRSTSAATRALETNCAIADVRADRAEIWAGLKSPIVAQQTIAEELGLRQDKVKVHVIAGRRLVRSQAVLRRRARGGRDLARRWASRSS